MAGKTDKIETVDEEIENGIEKKEVVRNVEYPSEKEFDFEKNVTVKSIAKWTTGFARVNSIGDVTIPPHGSIRISRNEIISQSQVGNILFNGIDGVGSHSTLYIDDAQTRVYLGFETEDGSVKQKVFSDNLVKEIFKINSQDAFEQECRKSFCTRSEKYALIDAIRRLKLNDFQKIRFIEKYTGYKAEA